MKYRKFILALFISGFSFMLASSSYAKDSDDKPIVIEMFGREGCPDFVRMQEKIMNLLRDNKNIVFLNCMMSRDLNNGDIKMEYEHQFCNGQAAQYAQRLSFWGGGASFIIINGLWEANAQNILPAINMGKQDSLKSVEMSIQDESLYISVPDLDLENSGSLYLYRYMSTKGYESLMVNSDAQLTQEIKATLAAGQSVPFVTKEVVIPYRLRPVVSRVKLASWENGQAFDMVYPLNALPFISQEDNVDMSYVVVVHDGKDFGRILAVGEVISNAEEHKKLPLSMPLSVDFGSMSSAENLGQ